MKKYFLNNLPFIGLFVFVTFNVIAMLYYPGGSIFDRDKVGYDCTRNFLSQLGRVNAYITDSGGNQISNSFSFMVWSTGMSLTGIIFFVYYLCLPSIFNKSILSYVGSFFAVVASICFVLTGAPLRSERGPKPAKGAAPLPLPHQGSRLVLST